jgi:hypothetical protein
VRPEQLFSLANAVALAGWIALAAAPRWRAGATHIAGLLVPGLLAAVYVMLVALRLPGAPGGFATLADVATLFADPWLLLAGWVHYLAFDLFVGAWEVRDARRRQIPHLLVVPCLVLTFLLGPTGLLAYLALRRLRSGASPAAAAVAET